MRHTTERLKGFLPAEFRANRAANREARKLAATSKRLDLCAAQVAQMLHLAGSPAVEGKTCVELGAGWVLSHAVVFHLLGARKVIATDIAPLARPSYLRDAVRGAVPYIVRDALAPFSEHHEVRRRLDRLLAQETFTFESLRGLGIEYVAPVAFAEARLGTPVDFIYSFSVLEHVPADMVAPMLRNLTADLGPGGMMLHAIHLEDHRDIAGDPFQFLAEPADRFTPEVQSARGNRIRKSEWRRLFAATGGLSHRVLYEWRRRDRRLPERIDPAVANEGEDDLRVSHLGIMATRTGGHV